jgi:hypothetical protein
MDSLKRQSGRNSQQEKPGVEVARLFSILAITERQRKSSVAMRVNLNSTKPITISTAKRNLRVAKPITGQILNLRSESEKMSSFVDTEQVENGMRPNSKSRVVVVRFAGQRFLTVAVSICSWIITTIAIPSVKRATNAVAGFFVGAATLLLSGSKLTLSGESRLSPILGGTHE